MTEKLLEAYETKVAGEKSFKQKLARMNTITKIVFWFVIIGGVILVVLTLIFPEPFMLIATTDTIGIFKIAEFYKKS